QRQRVLLARAICQNPEVIVLDEPTSFLDIKYKLELLATLKTMAREQKMAIVLSLHELDLAQKISDTVLCVKDGQIERYGTPDAVFTEGYIRHLYDLSNGSYNSTFGCLELAAPSGAPEVFVIAGGDSASGTFRALQRQGIPFATGVLHPGDVDYSVATALAAVVICEKPFEPISRARIEEAKQVLRQCRRVICCLSVFGSMNQGNEELLRFAENQGLLVDDTATGLPSAGK
ncbi:MAG: ABC transporter ATP-binding protein, partial [Pygmaiobacter sp.]